jgi:chromate transporter
MPRAPSSPQALPGPLFNFAAYLGAITAMNQGYLFLWGAIIAWLGLFAPGLMLIFGVLPYWHRFRQWVWYKRALPGFNSAAVGLVVASVFQMMLDVLRLSPFPNATLGIGIIAYTAVDVFKLFEPAVVVAGGVLGLLGWGAKMY